MSAKNKNHLKYIRITDTADSDIPGIVAVMKLPEVARYLSFDEGNYWKYVTSAENVFFFKVFDEDDHPVATTHCEITNGLLSMDILVFPEYRRQGIATAVLADIQSGKLPLDFQQTEVAIDETNLPSVGLFEKAGFSRVSKEEELFIYRKRR